MERAPEDTIMNDLDFTIAPVITGSRGGRSSRELVNIDKEVYGDHVGEPMHVEGGALMDRTHVRGSGHSPSLEIISLSHTRNTTSPRIHPTSQQFHTPPASPQNAPPKRVRIEGKTSPTIGRLITYPTTSSH